MPCRFRVQSLKGEGERWLLVSHELKRFRELDAREVIGDGLLFVSSSDLEIQYRRGGRKRLAEIRGFVLGKFKQAFNDDAAFLEMFVYFIAEV